MLAGLDLDWLGRRLSTKSLPGETALAVTDREGTFLVRFPNPSDWIGRRVPERLQHLVQAREAVVTEETGVDGARRIGAVVPISFGGDTDLVVAVGLSKTAALAAIDATTRREIVVAGLAALLAIAAVVVGGRRLIGRPLDELAATAARWKAGEYRARLARRPRARELARLNASLEGMAETMAEREGALRESEQRFRRVFEESPLGKATADANFRFREVNPALCRMVGYAPDELLAMSFLDLVHPEDRAACRRHAGEIMSGAIDQHRIEERFVRKTGEIFWVAVNMAPIREASGRPAYALGIIEDIDRRKRLEQDLRELNESLERQVEERARQLTASRARLRAFFENSLDWLALHRVKPDGRIFYEDINPACAEAYGLIREKVVGQPLEAILGVDQAAIPAEIQRECVRTGRPGRYTTERTLTGRTFVIDVTAVPVPDEVEDGDRFVITAARDVTARERFAERLRQAQKMEAVGQLTGGIAHDFNNLLTAVIPNLEMIAEDAESVRTRRLADTALKAAQRGATLIQQLLSFARRQALHPTSVDVARQLGEIEPLLRRVVGAGVDITVRVTDPIWPAEIDAAQFESAIMNLVVNGRDAMPTGGRIEIRAENLSAAAARTQGLLPADFVVVTVSDTGTGIDPTILPQVFDPFFTTKDVGKGSGLGLAMVQGFAAQSGGQVRIDSTPERGTTVTLYLPRATEQERQPRAEGAPPKTSAAPAPAATGVLVVEDDPFVRDTVLALLEPRGYRVTTAENAAEALALLRADPRINVLFTDLVMPGGLSGLELARAARAMQPALQILITSGYAEQAAQRG
ncbi:MAG: PAS domain S-box protein, partial [Alphaproteobacteria bacterium]|nr:PAS domain S-box protein [Alphaproteobacteria bacterium]